MTAVRPATRDDLDEVSALFDAYRVFYGYPSDAVAARSYLDQHLRSGTSTILVALSDTGVAVGFTQLYPSFCSLELAPILVLYDLYVSPDARGAGVATALLDAARALGVATGAARLELSTAHTNLTAQRLYESHGWKPDTEYRHYELTLG